MFGVRYTVFKVTCTGMYMGGWLHRGGLGSAGVRACPQWSRLCKQAEAASATELALLVVACDVRSRLLGVWVELQIFCAFCVFRVFLCVSCVCYL